MFFLVRSDYSRADNEECDDIDCEVWSSKLWSLRVKWASDPVQDEFDERVHRLHTHRHPHGVGGSGRRRRREWDGRFASGQNWGELK